MRIVLIDDELDICVVMKFMLERAGFHVTSFTSPIEAQLYLENAEFDVVVSDFQMTPITGLALFRWIKENNKTCPFILLTGEPFMNQDELEKEGIHQVLFKPHGLDDIVEVLQQLN
jgi:two-component system C4-dicarboxylate transport response regulator DctD